MGVKYCDYEIKGICNDFCWDDGIVDNGGYCGYLLGIEWFYNLDFYLDVLILVSDYVVDNSVGDIGVFNFLVFDFGVFDNYLKENFS